MINEQMYFNKLLNDIKIALYNYVKSISSSRDEGHHHQNEIAPIYRENAKNETENRIALAHNIKETMNNYIKNDDLLNIGISINSQQRLIENLFRILDIYRYNINNF